MHLTRWLLMACVGGMLADAQALTLGPPPARIALGRPLNVSWPLRLDPGEILEPECVSAELTLGDKPVPLHKLRWTLEPGPAVNERVVHVVSLVTIDEPVLTLQVSAGCSAKVSRRFTAFAEPPLSAAAPAATGQPVSEPAAMAADNASAPQVRLPAKPWRNTAQSLQAAVDRPSSADAATVASNPPSSSHLALDKPDVRGLQNALTTALAQHGMATAQEAAQDAAQSAEAASASAVSARAAAERLQTLEERVTRLLAENQQQREQMQVLRQRVSRGEAASRSMPWLLLGLLLCLGAAAWLAMKLRRQQRDAQPQWWAQAPIPVDDARLESTPAQPSDQAVAPDRDSAYRSPQPMPQGLVAGPAPALAAAPKAQAWPPATPVAAATPDRHFTTPADSAAAATPELDAPASLAGPDTAMNPVSVQPDVPTTLPLPRTLSVEELMDLEQQSDFFVALGQDDSAIDLLMSHLRDSGGTSPLPYLKLLEIYRRRNEREAHDRIRSRFNLRFNARVPAWGSAALPGRTLTDYPAVVARLERAWPSPIDAMAELETLLVRKEGDDPFALPAYLDLLMLHAVVRELLGQDPAAPPGVDVLLPLAINDSERIALDLELPAVATPPATPLRQRP